MPAYYGDPTSVIPLVVSGANPQKAWQAASAEIIRHREVFNLFTEIEMPYDLDSDWLKQHCPRSRSLGREMLRDVVDTIFPVRLAQRYPDRDVLYAQYLKRHDRAMRMRRNRSVWGTYFERLIRFPESETNQLETVINKLRTWRVRSTTGLVFHLSTPAVDGPRTRGGPCWHFAELLWNANNSVDLVVVYRNHDFFNKALGNFIALGQLLKFICDASGKQTGRVLSHSIHAYNGGSVRGLRELMMDGPNV